MISELELIEKLLTETPKEKRCPYLARDEIGSFCSKGLKEKEQIISEGRRLVCDIYSLQLWCLDKERYKKCIFYQGGKLP